MINVTVFTISQTIKYIYIFIFNDNLYIIPWSPGGPKAPGPPVVPTGPAGPIWPGDPGFPRT